jgi:hypothetical protein
MAYAITNSKNEMGSLDWYLQDKRSEAIGWTDKASESAYFPTSGRAEDVMTHLGIAGEVVQVNPFK